MIYSGVSLRASFDYLLNARTCGNLHTRRHDANLIESAWISNLGVFVATCVSKVGEYVGEIRVCIFAIGFSLRSYPVYPSQVDERIF